MQRQSTHQLLLDQQAQLERYERQTTQMKDQIDESASQLADMEAAVDSMKDNEGEPQ